MTSQVAFIFIVICGLCFAENVPIQPRDPPPGLIQPREPPVIQPRQTATTCSNVNYAFNSVGAKATLNSINYAGNYPSGLNCKYYLTSPAGTTMSIECSDFYVPCGSDYMYFSLIGSSTFSDVQSGYCAAGARFSQVSTGNKLNIGFVSGGSSYATRRYSCMVTVLAGSTTASSTTAAPVTTSTVASSTVASSASSTTAASTSSSSSTCTCGTKFPMTRIVGGTDAAAGEFPWRVLVFVYDSATGSGGICGGTIISPNWVLTAAHCTMNFKTGYKINVYYNTTANPVTTGTRSQMIVSDRYVQHPAYSRTTLDNDMTLVHLSTPITYGRNVGPICLPYGSLITSTYEGFEVEASGWGSTNVVAAGATNNDSPSNTLKKVTLPVMTTATCAQSKYYGTQITPNMICTFRPNSDTCQGDSGGSIDYKNTNNGLWYALGVTSFGVGCATDNYPGVYARVSNYLSWIETTTAETYCQK